MLNESEPVTEDELLLYAAFDTQSTVSNQQVQEELEKQQIARQEEIQQMKLKTISDTEETINKLFGEECEALNFTFDKLKQKTATEIENQTFQMETAVMQFFEAKNLEIQ